MSQSARPVDGRLRVMFDEPLAARHCEDLARFVYFIDEEIEDFEFIPEPGGAIAGISLGLALPDDDRIPAPREELLRDKLLRVVSDDISKRIVVPSKELWRLPGAGPARDVFAELVDTGAAFRPGPGQVAVGGPLLKVMRYFDNELRNIVLERHDAVEYEYPTLLPTEVIDRCGYPESFPQFLMYVTSLHRDVDSYQQFAELRRRGDAIPPGILTNVSHCLPPTMCFHTYHHYAGRRFDHAQTAVVTSVGKSFRHESKYEHGLERLWDFTIREIVFLGDKDFVQETRRLLMDQVRDLLCGLGLAASCEVANDPFFLGADRSRRMALQALAESKYELRMPVGDGRTLAAGSFNYADDFFTGRFDIGYADGAPLRSGCAGFGLERLAYAFLCQYGPCERDWPPAVAAPTRPDPTP
ncbi:hypothetical protein [Kutzneria sp. NPDC052558]|uniref:hypothetical protein n=1 Tax=Kutzneria sp. NPDC052558 TaxID=3364121 RepID=UPI0037CAD173